MKVVEFKVSEVRFLPYNPNRLPRERLDGLASSHEQFGILQPIVVNERQGKEWKKDERGLYVVGGEHRLRVARRIGRKTYPGIFVRVGPEDERVMNLALNNHGDVNLDAVTKILAELRRQKVNLASTGFMESEIQAALERMGKARRGAEDAAPEVPKKARTKPGDLLELGDHRVLCGDSTNAEHVRRLLGNKRTAIMVTDPPYGIGVDLTWRDGLVVPRGTVRTGKVANDDRIDWSSALKLQKSPIGYVWHASMYASEIEGWILAAGYRVRQIVIWRKQVMVISRATYQWQHESCFYIVKPGEKVRWFGGRKQTTVWDAPTPNMAFAGGQGDDKRSPHPTQKPVAIFERPIGNHTREGEIAYDPFIGSGTSIIAAEKINRVCYGMEIDPRYCDVIRDRWEAFTGRKA